MTSSIRPGQTYRAVKASPGDPQKRQIRIRVVTKPYANAFETGKVDIETVRPDGTGVRLRRIKLDQLHATATTRGGKPRRTGYVLEEQ